MFTFPVGFMGGKAKEFPIVESMASGFDNAVTSSKQVAYPSGIVAGELLVLVMCGWRDNATPVMNLPTGWTRVFTSPSALSNLRSYECIYKIADGSESGSLTISYSTLTLTSQNMFRISGASGVVEGNVIQGRGGKPDPQSLTPSFGNTKTLWLALMGHFNTPLSQTAPTEYSDNAGQVANTGTDYTRTAWGTRELKVATEDPNTFSGTTNAAYNWYASTIAIEPK